MFSCKDPFRLKNGKYVHKKIKQKKANTHASRKCKKTCKTNYLEILKYPGVNKKKIYLGSRPPSNTEGGSHSATGLNILVSIAANLTKIRYHSLH